MHFRLDGVHIEPRGLHFVIFPIRQNEEGVVEGQRELSPDFQDVVVVHGFRIGDAKALKGFIPGFVDIGGADDDRAEEIASADFVASDLRQGERGGFGRFRRSLCFGFFGKLRDDAQKGAFLSGPEALEDAFAFPVFVLFLIILSI